MSRTGIYEEIAGKKAITVNARSNARKTAIISYDPGRDEYRIDVAAPAEGNRANLEIIKHLGRMTGKRPRIKSGLASKRKNISFS